MNTPSNQTKAGAAVWTILSLLVVVLVIFSFFAVVAKRGTDPEPKEQEQTDVTTAQNRTPLPQKEPVTEPKEEKTEPTVIEPAEDPEPAAPTVSLDQLSFVLPVAGGQVQKGYSDSVLTYSLTMNDYRVHTGLDFYAPVGTQVLACADGIVSNIYDDPFLGRCILIDHGAGLESVYCNLSEAVPDGLMIGSGVVGGEVIGGVGETMKSESADSPHLHFAMRFQGQTTDPGQYLGAVPTAAGADGTADE